jgi:hypothetical protein
VALQRRVLGATGHFSGVFLVPPAVVDCWRGRRTPNPRDGPEHRGGGRAGRFGATGQVEPRCHSARLRIVDGLCISRCVGRCLRRGQSVSLVRVLIPVASRLFIASVLCYAHAWGIVYWSPMPTTGSARSPSPRPTFVPDEWPARWSRERRTSPLLEINTYVARQPLVPDPPVDPIEFRAWLNTVQGVERRYNDYSARETRIGWPVYTHVVQIWECNDRIASMSNMASGISIRNRVSTSPTEGVLPVRVAWRGFGVWVIAMTVLLFGSRVVRTVCARVWRRGHSCCIHCGYPIGRTREPCPECGRRPYTMGS